MQKLLELRQSLAHDLEKAVEGEIRLDPFSKTLYATDASIYQIEPLGVVVPRRPEDLLAIVEVARRHQVPLMGRGGGTSLAGQTVTAGLCVDFSKYLGRTEQFNPEQRWVEVQPGKVLADLNREVGVHGLMFAPDPATSEHACVGGVVANNSSGMRSIVYGKTVNHVLGLTVLTSDGQTLQLGELDREGLEGKLAQSDREGELYRALVSLVKNNAELLVERYPKILRRVSGYNLDELLRGLRAIGYEVPEWTGLQAPAARVPQGFSLAPLVVGSEGSLALITRARLHLVEVPEARGLLVSHYSGLREALEGNAAVLELEPSASELLDEMVLGLARQQLEIGRLMDFLQGDPKAVVVAEFSGTPQQVKKALQRAAAHLKKKKLGYAHLEVADPAGMDRVWRVRKAGLPLLLGLKGDRKPIAFIEDTAVAPERLVEYVDRFDEIVRSEDTTAAYYAHASVGCLHIRPLLDLKDQGDLDRMQRLSERISDLVVEFGGSMSGEHGDGLARGLWNRKQFGDTVYELFREVKRIFDPENMMNPGKVVDSPAMTGNLRLGTSVPRRVDRAHLDWSREGGLLEAVELCNGSGVCRKTNRGTMCPSYQVTREEEHSTRGRSNLLRAALSGRLPQEARTSKRMYEAFDLCLECKGCKAECPSGVDVAKMKFEFLAGYYQANGVPLRSRMFAHGRLLNQLGCAVAPLANWVAESALWPPLAHALGIATQRRLPRFAPRTFFHWWKQRVPRQGRPVALFVDSFAAYNEPHLARAAVLVLERLGYAVELAEPVCCGRTFISKGLVEPARRLAQRNFASLRSLWQRGVPVVGIEPSCILAPRDDYADLIGAQDLKPVGANCFTLEEFLADHQLEVDFTTNMLLHGHCHQKALVGTGPSLSLLGRLGQVREIDSGCCGMAGSFGYEAEHYEISRAIGERRLLPAVREHTAGGGVVVAAGTSCRQQIRHFTGQRALHPIEVVARALGVSDE
ncbi:MAG: FAD-binding and (Fe-S)-binding domain-containing protein [Vulcanimicrobiota bacterium]